ncbi:glycerol-3-phosphate 1-O-acyltransferase PlsY [Aerococcus urinaehominis]|uniref:glycerol-3-phosphate 1-O-acyltransferase PlsY n=1 Tax=Aerococcus urinaehominis TaxID=128944 RepID=UPI0022863B59|nr:glycerol-3-phosphate 1-O-acyltransferase PlsY [Aerococcus urinaehominis]
MTLLVAYIIGSIPSGILLGKYVYHKDPRQFGSGNIGTTNAFRVFGVKGGLIVFLCDALKGAIPVWLAMWLNPQVHPLLVGIVAVIGHSFSLFLNFKGGKAVATSFGVAFAFLPIFALLAIGVFFVCLYFSRMVSLSSLVGTGAAFFMSFYYQDWLFSLIVGLIWLLMIIRHRPNLERIKNGTESKVPFGWGYKKNQ